MNSALSQQLLADLAAGVGAAGAEIFPHQYLPVTDQILLVRLSNQVVREASFLDERVLPRGVQGAWFTVDAVARAAASFPEAPVSYVFHAGHCGSTLVSRLIGTSTGAASLREPLPLRTLAFDLAEGGGAILSPEMFASRLGLLEKLWARGAPSAVVKATSMCTSLAARIVERRERRGIFITQAPQTHLAVLAAGQNALTDLRGFAQMRWRRVNNISPLPPLAGFSLGELAALTWACEGAAASQAELTMFDFDALLMAPAETLAAIGAALDIATSAGRLDAAVSGPILRQYSKSPDHAYDAALRNQIIAQSQSDHGAEIRKGMSWLERLANESAVVKSLLDHWT